MCVSEGGRCCWTPPNLEETWLGEVQQQYSRNPDACPFTHSKCCFQTVALGLSWAVFLLLPSSSLAAVITAAGMLPHLYCFCSFPFLGRGRRIWMGFSATAFQWLEIRDARPSRHYHRHSTHPLPGFQHAFAQFPDGGCVPAF